MAPQLRVEGLLLFVDRFVPIPFAPSRDLFQAALQALLHRPHTRSVEPSSASLRNMSQAEEIERVGRPSHPLGLSQCRPPELN
jgi:hypothetical protein